MVSPIVSCPIVPPDYAQGLGKDVSESDTEEDESGSEGESDDNMSQTSGGGTTADPWASLNWKDEFGREAYQTMKRGAEEDINIDDIVLELKTLRMANNADMGRAREMVVAFLLKRMPLVGGAEQNRVAQAHFHKWGRLIALLCQGEMSTALLRLQVSHNNCWRS